MLFCIDVASPSAGIAGMDYTLAQYSGTYVMRQIRAATEGEHGGDKAELLQCRLYTVLVSCCSAPLPLLFTLFYRAARSFSQRCGECFFGSQNGLEDV